MGIPRRKKDQALRDLHQAFEEIDREKAHRMADWVLLRLLDDPEITRAYEAVPKWYA